MSRKGSVLRSHLAPVTSIHPEYSAKSSNLNGEMHMHNKYTPASRLYAHLHPIAPAGRFDPEKSQFRLVPKVLLDMPWPAISACINKLPGAQTEDSVLSQRNESRRREELQLGAAFWDMDKIAALTYTIGSSTGIWLRQKLMLSRGFCVAAATLMDDEHFRVQLELTTGYRTTVENKNILRNACGLCGEMYEVEQYLMTDERREIIKKFTEIRKKKIFTSE